MSRRLLTRAELLLRTGAMKLAGGRRAPPAAPRSILVVPTLFSGDAMFLAPLFAKLRRAHPGAAIRAAAGRSVVPLFSSRPYGVEAYAHDPRDARCARALAAHGRPDLALVVGDNRFALLPAALGARWIVGFAGDRPAYKNRLLDELRPMAASPMAWGDMAATLVDGPPPARYRPGDWPAPAFRPFERPSGRYAVLHVESSTPLRHWEDAKWLALAGRLAAGGLQPVWSAAPRSPMPARIDPEGRYPVLGDKLDLAQLWHLVAGAALLVCPDTSLMHIGRLTGTPTLALVGPTSDFLFGPGEFWKDAPSRSLTVPDFPCRDQKFLFKRELDWVRRCSRSPAECPAPRCMHAIGLEDAARAALDCARHAR